MTTAKQLFHPSVEEFLNSLDLPSKHPYLKDQSHQDESNRESDITGTITFAEHFIPTGLIALDTPLETDTGLLLPHEQASKQHQVGGPNNGSTYDTSVAIKSHSLFCIIQSMVALVVSFVEEVGPGMVAAGHLFFRLFAPAILLVVAGAMLLSKAYNRTLPKRKRGSKPPPLISHAVASFLVMLCSLVMMTDTMYLLEYGQTKLIGLYLMTILLVYHCSPSHKLATAIVLPMTLIAIVVFHTCDLTFETSVEPGFYYDSTNPVVSAIAHQWPVENRQYSSPTWWAVNGDTRTGIPYFLNRVPRQDYVRRWVPIHGEREAVILDIAFPPDGIHRTDKPLYFVLCGLTGGSQEEYVKDFVQRQRQKGSTVAVMVTRGLMDSAVLGDELLHFARMSDIDAGTKILKRTKAPQQTLAGVGYSMGAISLGNYAARSGEACNLDAIVMISGALDTRVQLGFDRSERFWQPLLVKNLRDIILRKFVSQLQKRMTRQEIKDIAIARSLVSFDKAYSTKYHGFDDILDYYGAMGAMGDVEKLDGTPQQIGRIANVSVPLLMLHAIDDPIGTVNTIHNPKQTCKAGKGNTMLLITKTGGHVGWPIGLLPHKNAWYWMSNVASSFVETAHKVLQEHSNKPKTEWLRQWRRRLKPNQRIRNVRRTIMHRVPSQS